MVPPREEARERLLHAALRLFANQGFDRTSTRELAEAAQVNVAAISYYFGDKAGLYRTVFMTPQQLAQPDPARWGQVPLADALRLYFESFLAPLRHGEVARLCIRLRFRELLEPTGLWPDGVATELRPLHDALAAAIARHLGCDVDDEIQRLVVGISALAMHLHVARDVVDGVAPQLNQGDDALDRWTDSLTRMALAMVDGEARHRAAAAAGVAA